MLSHLDQIGILITHGSTYTEGTNLLHLAKHWNSFNNKQERILSMFFYVLCLWPQLSRRQIRATQVIWAVLTFSKSRHWTPNLLVYLHIFIITTRKKSNSRWKVEDKHSHVPMITYMLDLIGMLTYKLPQFSDFLILILIILKMDFHTLTVSNI